MSDVTDKKKKGDRKISSYESKVPEKKQPNKIFGPNFIYTYVNDNRKSLSKNSNKSKKSSVNQNIKKDVRLKNELKKNQYRFNDNEHLEYINKIVNNKNTQNKNPFLPKLKGQKCNKGKSVIIFILYYFKAT